MKPLPFSWTHYDTFTTCPRQFYGKIVLKKFKEPETEALTWGRWVHEQFEKRQKHGCPLPQTLKEHEPFMTALTDMRGEMSCEEKVGISKDFKPCGFFDKNVWYRAAIDFKKLMPQMAYIVDYKTGKPKPKWGQLKLNALHTFMKHPEVKAVKAEFYWTQTKETSSQMFYRDKQSEMWAEFVPNLKQMLECYRAEEFPPRQNGLCKAYCPDLECEFNGRKK